MVILDGGDSEKIPERGAIFLVVQEPATVAVPTFNCISNLGHFIRVCFRSLKKSAAPTSQKPLCYRLIFHICSHRFLFLFFIIIKEEYKMTQRGSNRVQPTTQVNSGKKSLRSGSGLVTFMFCVLRSKNLIRHCTFAIHSL